MRLRVRKGWELAWAAGLVALGLAGCAGAGAPPHDPFQPLPTLGAVMPDETDRAARDLAAAVLADDEALARQRFAEIEALEADRLARGEPPTGLIPVALDARNATLPDARRRREASRKLLKRRDVPTSMRTRLKEEVEDDPLRLAGARIRDERVRRFGRAANAVMEPLGQSMMNISMAPYRLGISLIGLMVAEHQEDDLTTAQRQALAHWKEYVERNPDDPRSVKLIGRIRRAQKEWYDTQRDHAVAAARGALGSGDWLLAAVFAQRALQYRPEDRRASRLLAKAEAMGNTWAAERAHSLEVAEDPATVDPIQRELAVALLVGDQQEIEAQALALRMRAEERPYSDEAGFAVALVRQESGEDGRAWESLQAVAEEDFAEQNMARHAEAAFYNPNQNPYRAFKLARLGVLGEELRWLLLGRFKDGARRVNLPRIVEWILDAPSIVGAAMNMPQRLMQLPFKAVDWDAPAVWARRYLERRPQGDHAHEVRSWLRGYESKRGNKIGAWLLAQDDESLEPSMLSKLREAAARQALVVAQRGRSAMEGIHLLRDVATEYHGTEAGQQAGELARQAAEEFSPQRIRITRSFLEENPEVAGPEGLALQPVLFDGSLANGELHRHGVTLLGGRVVELAFVPAGGRESTQPLTHRELISEERIARLVGQLEEASHETLMTDRDARFEPDPDRDLFLERARLGLLDEPDMRPGASSHYTFMSMRERYGIVRSRESILPVELVLKGSFHDMGLGAFPRIRMPKPTPDAFLYK